jgi:hypothetical protein
VTEVALFTVSGGLVATAMLHDLRQESVSGDASFMAASAGFRSLDGEPPKPGQLKLDIEATFRSIQALWVAYEQEFHVGMPVGRLRDRLLRPLLDRLGFQPIFQHAHQRAGGKTWAITHFGWRGDDAPPMILTDKVQLDLQPEPGRRSPHEELQGYLNLSAARWGILCNGYSLRLLRDFHHTKTRGYIQFDLVPIFQSASIADFRALYRLSHVSRFLPDALAPMPTAPTTEGDEEETVVAPADRMDTLLLERLHQRSLSIGVAAGRRLQPQVRLAIEELAGGILEANHEPAKLIRSDSRARFGQALYRQLLVWLYRMLFLLYAEQRGMLSDANDLYHEAYSLSRLRQIVEEGRVEGRQYDLWEGLKATFTAFSSPELARVLSVCPFNGELFETHRTSWLNDSRCANARLVSAIRSLTTMQIDNKVSLHLDYRNLGVEELGALYESLLDYTLRVAEAYKTVEGRVISPGTAYLAPLSVERGDLASYYSPPALVDLVLQRALDPVIEGCLVMAGTDSKAREQALLDLRVIDPACGSGAFLVGAVDRIAGALAAARAEPAEPTEAQMAVARRDVLVRCIYGVDKDDLAVELCKVVLWIHCAVPDAPLSFLEANVVWGDSLIGWPLTSRPREIPTDTFAFAKASGEDKKILASARRRNASPSQADLFTEMPPPLRPGELRLPSLLYAPEKGHEDVRRKALAYNRYLASEKYQRFKKAADLWIAAFFWTAADGDAPTTREYWEALHGTAGSKLLDDAAIVATRVNPLHWALTFPDVRDGFDCVIGNPPWEQFKAKEVEFFREAAPAIAALPSALRKDAIQRLADEDPALHYRWLRYRAARDRLAHYAKTCGRFSRTGGEANTYVLFTELAAELVGNHGRVGILVKSGIAIDAAQSVVWDRLVREGRVREVRDIVNGGHTGKDLIFPAVDAKERYSVLVLGPRRPQDTSFGASMLNMRKEEAVDRELVPWNYERVRTVCPATGTLLSARERWEIDLATELQERWGTLSFDVKEGPLRANPWQIRYVTLFHSSGSQDLFWRRDWLEDERWELQLDRSFRHADGRVAVPVFEGQMVNRFDHRARTYQGYTGQKKYGRAPSIPWVKPGQHADPYFEVEPRYWMLQPDADKRLRATVSEDAIVAYRDVGAPWRNSRSVKAALLFPTPATHKLPILVIPESKALGLVALLNSTVFDFLARVHVPGASLTSWVLSQCAAPGPYDLDPESAHIAERLSVTSAKLSAAYDMALRAWNEEERPLLEAECDARVARSYGLTRRQYEQLFDHFDVMARVEQKPVEQGGYGEYRTRRLCLEAFDRLG